MTSPLAAVRLALTGSVRSTAEIAVVSGLPTDVVAAVIDHLIRTGELRAEPLTSGCPADACGECVLSDRGCAGLPSRAVRRPQARSLLRATG